MLQTSALDGETDLKTRVIPSACMGIDFDLLNKIKVWVSLSNYQHTSFITSFHLGEADGRFVGISSVKMTIFCYLSSFGRES